MAYFQNEVQKQLKHLLAPDKRRGIHILFFCLFFFNDNTEVVGCGEGVVYLTSPGRPTVIGLQLDKACYPCSR